MSDDDADYIGTRPAGFVRQPHGGAIRPFPPGNPETKGASAKGVSMRAIRRQCRALLAEKSEAAMRQLNAMIDDPDSRVRIVAIKEWRECLFGPVTAGGLYADEGDEGGLDLTRLTADERNQAAAAVTTLRRLAAMARDRAAGIIEDGREGPDQWT